tara:strand:- start:61 stop:396 length:336 start_codon:yes stop_codon:yes gene_type:complete
MENKKLSESDLQLRSMVNAYAEDVNKGKMRFYPEDDNDDDYYEAYSIKYIIGDDGSFHDVMIMLAGGGPTIWLDTWRQEIRGSWGCDTYTKYIYDHDYILDYWEEQYQCIR